MNEESDLHISNTLQANMSNHLIQNDTNDQSLTNLTHNNQHDTDPLEASSDEELEDGEFLEDKSEDEEQENNQQNNHKQDYEAFTVTATSKKQQEANIEEEEDNNTDEQTGKQISQQIKSNMINDLDTGNFKAPPLIKEPSPPIIQINNDNGTNYMKTATYNHQKQFQEGFEKALSPSLTQQLQEENFKNSKNPSPIITPRKDKDARSMYSRNSRTIVGDHPIKEENEGDLEIESNNESSQYEALVFDKLEQQKPQLKEIFQEYQTLQEVLTQECLDLYLNHISQQVLNQIATENAIEEMRGQIETKISQIITKKIQDYKFKDAMTSKTPVSAPYTIYKSNDTMRSDQLDHEIGVTFNEFYHELFMTMLSTIKRHKNDHRFQLIDDQLLKSHRSNQFLSTNPNTSRGVKPKIDVNQLLNLNKNLNSRKNDLEMQNMNEDKKFKMIRLQTIFDSQRRDVEGIIRQRTGQQKGQLSDSQLQELIHSIIDSLPVKIIKMHNYDDQADFTDHMIKMKENKSKKQNYKEQLQNVIENVIKSLDQQQMMSGGRSNRQMIDFDQVLHGFKEALILQGGDEYEIIEKDAEEDQNLAEIDGLDDFLLMDQETHVKSPTLLDHLQETLKTYQMMLDNKKFKTDVEKQKLHKIIKSLQAQVDQLMKDIVKQQKQSFQQQKSENKLQKLETKFFMPNILRRAPNDYDKKQTVTTKQEKREKTLKGIFDFYCKQQLLVGRKATFDEIKREYDNMNMGEFFRFCLDFKIPQKKEKIMEIFKKASPNHREISYNNFKDILEALFIEVNKDRARNLKKRLQTINTKNIIGLAVYKDAQKQLIQIKKKSADLIMEEAYLFLELDNPQKVESKKKGINLPFNVRDKDNHQQQTSENAQNSKIKLRHFSQEEKLEIKQKVLLLKQQREQKKKEDFDQKQQKYYIMRSKLISQLGGKHTGDNFDSYDISRLDSKNTLRAENSFKKKTEFTLQQLTQLNYKDLNGKNEDDFNPSIFGFEKDPALPKPQNEGSQYKLTRASILLSASPSQTNLENTGKSGLLKLQADAELTENGLQNGLIWNRGNVMAVEQYNKQLFDKQQILSRINRNQQKPPFTINGQVSYGRIQPSQLNLENQNRMHSHNNQIRGLSPIGAQNNQGYTSTYQQMDNSRIGNWVDSQYEQQSLKKKPYLALQSQQNSTQKLLPLTNYTPKNLPQIQSQNNLIGYYNKAAENQSQLSLPPIPNTTKAINNKNINL